MNKTLRSDKEIKENIKRQIARDARVNEKEVEVEVKDGIVALSGTVPSRISFTAAADNAWIIPGVRDVNNELVIRYFAEEQVPEDKDIQAVLENIFEWSDNVDATRVDVSVESGVVTLEGSVDSLWQKKYAEDTAWHTRGVVDVVNELAVVPTEDMVDEAVAQEIIEAVKLTGFIDVDTINIEVNNGEVTLSGNVNSWRAMRIAYATTFFTTGVTKVNNNLNITYARQKEYQPERVE